MPHTPSGLDSTTRQRARAGRAPASRTVSHPVPGPTVARSPDGRERILGIESSLTRRIACCHEQHVTFRERFSRCGQSPGGAWGNGKHTGWEWDEGRSDPTARMSLSYIALAREIVFQRRKVGLCDVAILLKLCYHQWSGSPALSVQRTGYQCS